MDSNFWKWTRSLADELAAREAEAAAEVPRQIVGSGEKMFWVPRMEPRGRGLAAIQEASAEPLTVENARWEREGSGTAKGIHGYSRTSLSGLNADVFIIDDSEAYNPKEWGMPALTVPVSVSVAGEPVEKWSWDINDITL